MNATPNLSPSTFEAFWRLGYRRLLPIVPPGASISEKSSLAKRLDALGKIPGVMGSDGRWSSYDWLANECDETDLARWKKMGAGTGIKTGQGIVAIDADTKNLAWASLIQMEFFKRFGATPCRIGDFPKALYLIRISAPMKYTRVEFGELDGKGRLKDRVEILSDGRQFVAHGIHPGTQQPYVWTRPLVPFDKLPVFSPADVLAFLEELRSILPAAKPLITEGATTDVSQASLRGPIDTVRKAVAATPNTSATFGTREAYRDYGYAIRAALPDNEPEAFEIFSEWCARWQDGENNPDVVAADWKRFKPPFRRGASWLYELAEQHAPEAFKKVDVYFDVIPEPEASLFDAAANVPAERKTDTYPVLRIGDIVNRPPPVYLVRRHFPEISVGFLYSVPGAGKTFLALDAALHIAYGRPSWHGDEIRAPTDTVVVYIAAEGSFGFRNRIMAWLKKWGIAEHSDRFVMIERTIDFMDAGDIDRLLRTVSSAIRARPVLIVVDTVSQAIPGADENLQKEMTLFVGACNRLKEAFRCVVLGIHHAGKDGTMRGSTVLRGAGDFVFRLERKEAATVGRLWCEKQKDGPSGWSEPYRFDLVGLDDGESSWVPERCEQSIGPDKTLTPVLAAEVLEAMDAAWKVGEPWGRTYRSGDLMAARVMVRDFDFTAEKAEELLKLWTESGEIIEAVHNTKTKRKGFRVVRETASAAPVSESIFG
ncbi:MAG: AAA family ATPase [Bradyrhizobium sp.]